MAVADQLITDRFALFNGDSCEALPTLPSGSVHLSIYSPPFALDSGGALYHYSSDERDLSNARTYAEFWRHYSFIVRELARVTMPGRLSLVHCTDVPTGNTGCDGAVDFPGHIIKLHRRCGFEFAGRICIWKEPLTVRNRTMTKGLAHKTIVDDSTKCSVAHADYLLRFRRRGDNPIPVSHEQGLLDYAGERKVPAELLGYRGWTGKQTENRYSHWIWRQYASSVWDDVRLDRVLPFRPARDQEDEKHVHPLQLDVVERGVVLGTNPGETVLTPFMGVGSEVYGAVINGRRGVGIELKPSYYRQAVANLEHAATMPRGGEQAALFEGVERVAQSGLLAPLPADLASNPAG